jgi:hypothetical protein
VIRSALRALAVAIYSLAGAAFIVDAGRAGGLPDGFPYLTKIREVRARFGGEVPPPVPPPVQASMDEAAGAGRSLPSGAPDVRVNRGLP